MFDLLGSPLALEGYRVLELAGDTGHYAGKLLADLGADVIKIEPSGGDPSRRTPPLLHDRTDPDSSLSFLYHNLNKRGVTLNLDHPDGRRVFMRLASTADALIETFPPGHLDALELGYERLQDRNPGLTLASITPYGQTGPRRDLPGTDLTATAMGGLMSVTGEPGRPPLRVVGDQAYHLAGCYAAYGIVLALFERLATGTGQHVDISLQEAVAAVIPESGVSGYLFRGTRVERSGGSRRTIFPYGIFRSRDGYVSIAGITMPFWDNIAAWIAEESGDSTITDAAFRVPSSQRAEFADLLTALIEQVTTRYTMEELYQEGQRRRFPIAPVNTPGSLAADRQLRERGFFVEVDHPAAGTLTYPGAPYAFSESPWRIRRPAPRLGEHNTEIYEGELGLSRAELATLTASGAI